jgi:hypothetical protein
VWTELRRAAGRFVRRHPRLDHLVRLHYRRNLRMRYTGFPRWDGLRARDGDRWARALDASRGGPEILVATSVGAFLAGATLESVLAAALTLRGARVTVLLCDGALPACMDCESTWFPERDRFLAHGPAKDLCPSCFEPARRMYERMGIPVLRYSDFLDDAARRRAAARALDTPLADIAAHRDDGISVGEHAVAGAVRFFASTDVLGEPGGEAVLRRYFEAALLTAAATTRLFRERRFACAVFHHGIYVPQGPLGDAARAAGVRVVNWNPAYRKRCFIFSHDDTYHHTLMDEPPSVWESLPWSDAMDDALSGYLKSRWEGTEDWIWFHEAPTFEKSALEDLGVDLSRPCVGLLSNVMWDAQLHYPANAFPDMKEWVVRTVRHFAARPELQLLIRIHPAEVRGTLKSRQPLLAEIRKSFPQLPPNVFVIPPTSRISTYSAMSLCNAVLIYGTKTGVELACQGVPVVVAGEAWVRNKGITHDAATQEEYFRLLDRLPFSGAPDADRVRRARRYAFHFFFRRMIPLEFMEPYVMDAPYRLASESLDDFLPGRSPGLDVVCDGILKGTPFIYPAERDFAGTAAPAAPVRS